MKRLTTALGILAFALSQQTNATPINLGGVILDPDSAFDFQSLSTLFQDTIAFPTGFNIGTLTLADDLQPLGLTLNGIGEVASINGDFAFCPGCELTFEFGGFLLTNAQVNTSGAIDLVFTDGFVNFFVDDTPDFSTSNINAATIANATDGVSFLELVGHTDVDTETGLLGTLFGNAQELDSGSDDGSASGLLDVVGGLAADNFDTDSLSDLIGNFADLNFNSSFAPINGSDTPDGFTLTGSVDLFGNTIPEPITITLLGLGLIGVSLTRRQRR